MYNGRFEFLEHTADVYVAAYGRDLAEAFENAALAMFETMTNTEMVRAVEEDGLEVSAEDDEALLYSWLQELLLRFEIKGKIFSRFKVDSVEKTPNGYALKARMWGEPFDPARHESRTDVKAVTYHRMEILRNDSRVTVKYILDI